MNHKMKKRLSLLLSGAMILMLNSQFVAATGTVDNPWDAKAEFSSETAEPGVWRYSSSFDGGETFETQTVYAEKDWGNFWYESADEGIGQARRSNRLAGLRPDHAAVIHAHPGYHDCLYGCRLLERMV